ncbi:MAG: hypothetical protein ACLTYN_05275 [Dysosmobacter welbionis]
MCFKDQSDAINKKVCEHGHVRHHWPALRRGPGYGRVWDKPHKDDVALVSNSDATARSVTRPRSPVWNNYLRLAKIVTTRWSGRCREVRRNNMDNAGKKPVWSVQPPRGC